MKSSRVKDDEMIVKQNDFGMLVDSYVRSLLDYNPYLAEGPHGTDARLREWWPTLEGYWQRHIQSQIEVAIAIDDRHYAGKKPLQNKELWQKFIADFRPGKTAFTVKYHCHKCKTKDVKLWRGVHGCSDKDGNELLCATCLAPDLKVSDAGRAAPKDDKYDMGESDQINNWLPAIPVDDTYWGYSSVPSQDVEWWQKLATYPGKNK